jgi:hypothetical protein
MAICRALGLEHCVPASGLPACRALQARCPCCAYAVFGCRRDDVLCPTRLTMPDPLPSTNSRNRHFGFSLLFLFNQLRRQPLNARSRPEKFNCWHGCCVGDWPHTAFRMALITPSAIIFRSTTNPQTPAPPDLPELHWALVGVSQRPLCVQAPACCPSSHYALRETSLRVSASVTRGWSDSWL